MVIQKTNFITDYECKTLSEELHRRLEKESFGVEPFYHWIELPKESEFFLSPFFRKILEKQMNFLYEEVSNRDWKIHYVGFAYQTKGFPYHADAVWPEDEKNRYMGDPDLDHYHAYEGTWIPNYVPSRVFTSVTYLNDVVGGETHFPDLEISISPSRKNMVGFHCDEKHIHGVLPVSQGVRETLIFWFE